MDKTTSYELSRKMYDLGMAFNTERFWVFIKRENRSVLFNSSDSHDDIELDNCRHITAKEFYDVIPAPDIYELGKELPDNIKHCELIIRKDIENCYNSHYGSFILTTGRGLAECLGKMWCYLKENKLI